MPNPSGPNPAAGEMVTALKERGETVAWCESLTAGLGAATLATVAGASAVLRGGLVTYATELKTTLAGVDSALIAEHTVISASVAEAMAAGARARCGADWGLALTGVAGPDPQDGHAVGEVWAGLAAPDGSQRSWQVGGPAGLSGTRDEIRTRAVAKTLAVAVEKIRNFPRR
ncbi:CinA family protein [Corynebacterium confusum]|uniref:CinA family protein n=1 Tax=uncultured Corynebacterium sp. TaxID=159447 RepID=UPI0025FC7E29|nr:nicotinamide-nucleotide amidohydrolase family protein [uncultured Corynebacterium sp.]